MLVRKFAIAVAAAAATITPAAFAQKPAAPAPAQAQAPAAWDINAVPEGGMPTFLRPETPEKRQERLGTAEDPGINPDPNKHYWRFGKSYHITRYERRLASYETADGNYVRPMAMVNFAYEVYQQNEKYVWCWIVDIDDVRVQEDATAKAALSSPYDEQEIAYFARVRPQFTELTPPQSRKTVSFTESSEGLPQSGSWRNSLAVADMNGDGLLDLVAPPERKGGGVPVIFLGDGKGHWHEWTGLQWPHSLDYGSAVAADFNKDGHMDLAFAVHLNGLYVFLGDGKGRFTEVSEGLPRDFPTRRVVVADVDGDGYPDLITSVEGPTAIDNSISLDYGKVRAYLNRKKGKSWEGINVTPPDLRIGGDWLSVGRFNSDKYPDIILSSVFYGTMQVAQLSDGAKKWKAVASDGDLLPSRSYYLASTTGKFEKKNDEAVIGYTRFWPTDLDSRLVAKPAIVELTNVDRLVFTKEGVKRIPVMRWSGHAGVRALASGDFDGDGNLDLILANEEVEHREMIMLLGDGKGGFSKATLAGLPLEENNIYDIKVADVNGDGKPDVILMYEAFENRRDSYHRMIVSSQPGSIRVYLNGGAKSAPAEIKAAK